MFSTHAYILKNFPPEFRLLSMETPGSFKRRLLPITRRYVLQLHFRVQASNPVYFYGTKITHMTSKYRDRHVRHDLRTIILDLLKKLRAGTLNTQSQNKSFNFKSLIVIFGELSAKFQTQTKQYN